LALALDLERRRYGKEVVYTVVRAKHVYDSRWDSHFGEMMLDDTTVPGLPGGDIRFIAYDHLPGHPDPFLYWSEYACHVVSNGNLYFRSCDGAIIVLTSGQPTAAVRWRPEVAHAPKPTPREAPPVISHLQAREYAGCTTRVEGELRHIVNNGKQVLLGFHSPHQGYFKVLIPKAHWAQFGGAPDRRYRIGQRVRVSGAIAWYQGDPAVYARAPEQIEVG
jgi:hypothetical protein